MKKIKITQASSDAEKLEFVDKFFKDKSKAGKISASKLTAEERKERAKKAVEARIRIHNQIKRSK